MTDEQHERSELIINYRAASKKLGEMSRPNAWDLYGKDEQKDAVRAWGRARVRLESAGFDPDALPLRF